MDLTQVNLRPASIIPDLEGVIAAIYHSTADSTVWRQVAHRLTGLFGADAALLCHREGEAVRLLGNGLHNIDPEQATRLVSAPPTRAATDGGGGAHARRDIDDVAFVRGMVGLRHGGRVLTVVVPEPDGAVPASLPHLSVARAQGRLPFDAAQQDMRLRLSRHLNQALCIRRRFASRMRTADFDRLAVLHLGEAWLVMDRQMALVDCNPLARGFLMRSALMRLEAGMVRLRDAQARAALQSAIDSAWAGERSHLSLSSVEDARPVGLEFHPYFSSEQDGTDQPQAILVLVRELDRDLMLKIEAKAESSGLSRAERRVMVQLVRSGRPPAAIAAAIGTSERTVRCQLSSIFRKTGARNQQDLIRRTLMA